MAAALVLPGVSQATLVTVETDGTLSFSAETSLAAGTGNGYSGLALTEYDGSTPDPDHIRISAINGFGDSRTPEPVHLAADTQPGCTAPDSPGAPIICTSSSIKDIEFDLGDAADFVVDQTLTKVGFRVAGQESFGTPQFGPAGVTVPAGAMAIVADMGSGDDRYIGSPLSEQISDGPGTDKVQSNAPGGNSDTDVIFQPDTANPTVDDAGDQLETGDRGVVSYQRRSAGQSVTVTAHAGANDGAPGEHDSVSSGMGGTAYADQLTDVDPGFHQVTIAGFAGPDVLTAGATPDGGGDHVYGGTGNDTLEGSPASDIFEGGDGDDSINAAGDHVVDDATCGDGDDTYYMDAEGESHSFDCEHLITVGGEGGGEGGGDGGDAGGSGSNGGTETGTGGGGGTESSTSGTGGTTSPGPASTTPVGPAPGGTGSGPVASVVASPAAVFKASASGSIKADKKGHVRLPFSCAAGSCVKRNLVLAARVGKRRFSVTVAVPKIDGGKTGTVTVTLPKSLVRALKKAGQHGISATVGPKGAKGKKLRLVRG